MIGAIAIDDEPKAIAVIVSHISKLDNIELLISFHDPEKAISFLKQNPVDLVFLDIEMPKMSGFEMLKELQLTPNIIFTTAYSEFALDSYSHNAIDYLLKPFEFDRFKLAIEKAEHRIYSQIKKISFFFVKDGFKNIKISFDDILFVKGSGNYLDIVTPAKTHSPRMTFSDLSGKLPFSQFVRVHQSYIVQLKAINRIENNHVFIENYKIPISNGYREKFFQVLNFT